MKNDHLDEKNNHNPLKKRRWWKSSLLWRLVLSVFITVVAVQACIFAFSMKKYHSKLEAQIFNNARSAVISLLEARPMDKKQDFLSARDMLLLLKSSWITGVEMVDDNGQALKAYGETLSLPRLNNGASVYIEKNWGRYEFELDQLRDDLPYRLFVRVNATSIQSLISDYINSNLYLFAALAILLTAVLNLIISRSMLRPILTLKSNLLAASKDPENADDYLTSVSGDDEIVTMVNAANELIVQNAENLSKMKRQARDTIHQLAYYDVLTGLPNRGLYLQELEQCLEEAKNNDKKVVVAVMDLDRFKDINDTMGHQTGDYLLTAVGKRLKECLAPDIYVARAGDNSFSAFAAVDQGVNIQDFVVRRIEQAMKAPFEIKSQELAIRVSLGVSSYPEHGDEAALLLKNSDIALNKAKAEGSGTVCYYSENMQEGIHARFKLISSLRQAIAKNELELFYQPQFDVTKSAKIVGAEALIRWFRYDEETQDKVFVSPAEFIPLAEESGLIIPIGEWVLRESCTQAYKIHKEGHTDITVAVNISALQFQHPNFASMVKRVIKETGVDPKLIELELTESVFAGDIDNSIAVLQELRDFGLQLAIDDFGTGYSCLSYLSKFPIDRLKIDQSFVRNALENYEDSAIIKTIIKLGHSLKLNVIAEGVETAEHEAFLKAQECYYVQGYHYSRPLSKFDFEQFVSEYQES